MARLTKAQRDWRPGMPGKRRSIRVMFASVVLSLEAFAVLFGTLAAYGLHRGAVPAPVILTAGTGLGTLLVLACALLTRRAGTTVGWALQLLVLATGLVEPMMFLVGGMFALTWWYALRTGARLDRENAERDRLQAAWEAAHPADRDVPPEGGLSSGGSGPR